MPNPAPSPIRTFVIALAGTFLAWAIPIPSHAAGPVVLNEILAANQASTPVTGRFPDYVELYNTSNTTVALAGATLNDDSAATPAFTFPSGLSLAPGARLVVWCDRTPGLPAPQALIGIGSTGDLLTLTSPTGTVWDSLAFGLQIPDLSLSRHPDGTGPWQLGLPTPNAPNQTQPLTSPSLLRLNEWMGSPASGDDWIELFNGDSLPVPLAGLVFTDRNVVPPANRPVPALSFIAPHGFIQFFASDLDQPDADHLDFRLSADGETLTLFNSDRTTVLDRVTYGPQDPNTSGGRLPDGGDILIEFPVGQDSPGAPNFRSLTRVVISEVLSHSDPPFEDAIELLNTTDTTIDISHWWLSDSDANLRKYRIPAGSTLAPGGYLAFYEIQFGSGDNPFSLNSYEGDEVWLSTGNPAGELTGETTRVRFGPLPRHLSAGRTPTSIGFDFAPLAQPTFGIDVPSSVGQFRQGQGAPNADPTTSPIVLAELFFAPDPALTPAFREPFVELHNASGTDAPLFDPAFPTNAWRLRGDLHFDFPTQLTLAPDARLLVVSFNPASDTQRLADFRAAHQIPDAIPIFGPFQGSLALPEASLELQEPDNPEGPDKPKPGFVPYFRRERVDFLTTNPWPNLSLTSGLALQRLPNPPFANDPAAWSTALPTPGSPPKPTDSDNDGMPDDWETTYTFDPLNPDDALEDADLDLASNLDEYVAGTHPRNAADVLRLTATLASPANTLTFSFPAVAGRTYELQSRDTTPAAPWQSLTNLAPTQSQILTIPWPTPQRPHWYRLQILSYP
jgi:hypothetical protein